MAKKTFNLKQLLNDKSIEQKDIGKVEEANIYEFEVRTIDINDIEPSQDNFYNTKDIEDIKQSIELLGIEQNLIVTRYKDKYKLIAGHRRYFASKKLVEEGKVAYRNIPCRVKKYKNDIYNKLTMIMTNSTARELSDWEKMQQLLETEKLVIELKQEAEIKGRTRDLLSDILNISPSQLARYKAINNNLSEALKEAFRENKISYSVAYQVSTLSEEYQSNALATLVLRKELTLQDVSELKKQEESLKQIEGQVYVDEVDYDIETKEENITKLDEKIENEELIEEDLEQDQEENDIDYEVEEETVEEDIQEVEIETKVVHVIETESNQKKGCTFCNENCNFIITTDEGGLVINLDPLDKKLKITSKETGEVQQISPLYCLMCGRKL